MSRGRRVINSIVFPFESLTSKLHALVFIRYRFRSVAAAYALYAAEMLLTANALGVSSNYFIIGPVIVSALGFGLVGGLASGALGLPANLLIYAILGHPEFSPASKLIAELSGILVGLAFGRLADYFTDVEREIKRRMASEEALREALAEKELLLRELHHRVKNNLNVIKSLVQLQRNRSSDPAFLAATEELIGRIFAISLVHDQLDGGQEPSVVDPARYIEAIAINLASGLGIGSSGIGMSLGPGGEPIPVESAISLGLIVNEALTNALKHATPKGDGAPSVRLSFGEADGEYRLEIIDNGPGPGSNAGASLADPGSAALEPAGRGGLGLKLMAALARNLGGKASLEPVEGEFGVEGARFKLLFPRQSPRP
jgi:two-component sensor histidine kinase